MASLAALSSVKVHASFSGQESAPLFGQVQNMVGRAGCEFTALHIAQTADWFEIWSEKARAAKYIIVFFSDIYRSRFTAALKREAQLVIQLVDLRKSTKVFVFDPTKDSAADILVNLQDDAAFMGDWPGFKAFVANTPVVDGSSGGGSGGSGGAVSTVMHFTT